MRLTDKPHTPPARPHRSVLLLVRASNNTVWPETTDDRSLVCSLLCFLFVYSILKYIFGYQLWIEAGDGDEISENCSANSVVNVCLQDKTNSSERSHHPQLLKST